jgi:hypothetical protein
MTALAFKSESELQAHYAAVRNRLANPIQPKPKPEPAPVIQFVAPAPAEPVEEPAPYVVSGVAFELVLDAEGKGSYPAMRDILAAVCRHYNVPRNEIISTRRVAKVALVRHIAMYLMKRDTIRPLTEIAKVFDRDHTSVIHAVKRIQRLIDNGELTL